MFNIRIEGLEQAINDVLVILCQGETKVKWLLLQPRF